MRQLIILLSVFIISGLPGSAQTLQSLSTDVTSPKVLIISSYRVETDWSKEIIDEIVIQLNRQYPDIYIHVGHMNLDTYLLASNPLYTLRSILWSYADSDPSTVNAEDAHFNTLFQSDKQPDVLVFIGDDALLFYQKYGPWLGKWRNVPIVVCTTSERVTSEEWLPMDNYHFSDSMAPVEGRRKAESFIYKQKNIRADKDLVLKEHHKDNFPGYLIDVDYKLTGVKSTLPIRENLELMHQLVPNLEEIVWVDNDFYSSAYALWLVKKELSASFPDVKLVEIRQGRFNTDSIYNEILKPISNKAYLTYSWNVDGMYSRQTDEQIRTLFTNYSSVPLFSLTRRFLSNPYWVGGYYRPYSAFADKTVKQIGRVLNGEDANSIPFETVRGGKLILDQPLLVKYGLWENANSLNNVEYVNVPPTYYEKNESTILAGIIIGTILLCLLIFWFNRILYTRKIHKEYVRYRKLYDKLHVIYGHTSIDLALYDKEGKLVFCISRGREYMMGGDKDGLFTENLFENPSLNNKLRNLIKDNQPVNSEVTVETDAPLSSVDSERKVYQLMVNPLEDDNSQSAKYVAIAINLNEVIREREERERFESLVRFASDSSQMGIAFYNIDTAVGTATNSWYQNLNEKLSPQLLPAYHYVVAEDRELLLDYRKRVSNGEQLPLFNKDIRVYGKDGELHWITQYIFINESDNRMLIELNLNIDEQKVNENNLLNAKKKVERSIIETQEFLANINHEIRTPLNSIVGFSAILAASESEEERKEHVSLILKNNMLLTMLIDDVIELSKIDSGQTTFECEAVNVDELFNKVMATGYSELYNKQLNVVLELDKDHPNVYTDPEAVERLMSNLFSNAVKFTHEGTVTLGYRRKDDSYYFFVKDTGCGISPENRDRIFKRFVKLDAYAQGTGLGLALCKNLVEHLGGEMGVESEVGKGSTFWFALPLSDKVI